MNWVQEQSHSPKVLQLCTGLTPVNVEGVGGLMV